jgi:hypothetical protein
MMRFRHNSHRIRLWIASETIHSLRRCVCMLFSSKHSHFSRMLIKLLIGLIACRAHEKELTVCLRFAIQQYQHPTKLPQKMTDGDSHSFFPLHSRSTWYQCHDSNHVWVFAYGKLLKIAETIELLNSGSYSSSQSLSLSSLSSSVLDYSHPIATLTVFL